MNCFSTMTVAQRRYYRRFWPAMASYVVLLLGSVWTVKRVPPHEAVVVYGLALLPALSLLAVIVILGMYLAEEKDDFERTVVMQSLLWAAGGVLGLTTVWGFLEMFAEAAPKQAIVVAHLQPFWLWPLFMVLMGVSTPLIRWRYR